MIFYQNIDPVIFEAGPVSIRWYGLMFVIGLILNYLVMRWVFKREKYNPEHLDSIAFYLLVGMIMGARLGHVFFYSADYFLSNPIEIFKIWKGGLASHGAAIGVFLAYLLWVLIHKVNFSKYVDVFALGVPLTAGFVRIGNFFNSEIVGVKTDGSWGVVFERLGDGVVRHPSQLYEAGIAFLIFAILIWVYKKYYKKMPRLFFFFLMILLYFSTRFGVEFFKERHIVPSEFPLSMGQLLSVLPVIIALIYFAIFYSKQKPRKN